MADILGLARQAAIVCAVAGTVTGCHFRPKQWTTTPPTKPSDPAKVFDITWQTTDANGIPLNPEWGSQSWPVKSALPPADHADCKNDPRKCTGQRFVEDWAPKASPCRLGVASGFFGPFPAHFDWSIATFTGVVRPSVPAISEDNDFNFIFQPGEPNALAGLTEANANVPFDTSRKYIELELLSHEVDHRFSLKWWRDFTADADRVVSTSEEDTDAQARIDEAWTPQGRSSRGVVVGLFGVDCEHGCRSELHPVYALAVETDMNPTHNVWQVFARNWGNGGSCSTLNHEFNAPRLALKIPPPSAGATPDRILNANFARSDDTIVPPVFSTPAEHDGLLVTFGLAAPAVRGLEELEVTIVWGGAVTPPPAAVPMRSAVAPVTTRAPSSTGSLTKKETKKETEWQYIHRVVNSLPPDIKSSTEKKLVDQVLKRPPRGEERDQVVEGIDTTIRASSADRVSSSVQPTAPRTKLQDTASDRSEQLWSTLCEATQGQLPTFNGNDMSGICRTVNWKKTK